MRSFLLLLIVVLVVGAVAGYVGVKSYFSAFEALDSEAPIASITMTQVRADGELRHQRYDLGVEYANGVKGSYQIAGDFFRMEAEVITPKGWAATLAGGEARARMKRLEGGYNQLFETAPPLCFKDGTTPSTKFWEATEPCIAQYDLKDAQYKAIIKGQDGLIAKLGEQMLTMTKSSRDHLPFRSGAGVDLVDGGKVLVCLTEDALVVRTPEEGCKGLKTEAVTVTAH